LNPNGSEDHELKIKSLNNIAVRDYSQVELEEKNGLGSLTATDIATVESVQVKLAAQVAKAKEKLKAKRAQKDAEEESSSNNKEHEEVFTLGRMSTRSQTRVSQYFTHAEVEADIEAVRVQEEQEESDIDDEEPEFNPSNDDEDFDEGRQGDEDIANENM
jgi:hypothetical protein